MHVAAASFKPHSSSDKIHDHRMNITNIIISFAVISLSACIVREHLPNRHTHHTDHNDPQRWSFQIHLNGLPCSLRFTQCCQTIRPHKPRVGLVIVIIIRIRMIMIVLRIRMRIARIGMRIMMKMMRFWMTLVGTEKMRWIMDYSMFSRWHEHCPICEQCYPELGINIATLTTRRMSLERTSWNPWKKSPELLYITIPNLERVEKSEEKSPDAKRSKRKNLSWLSSPIAPMAVIRTYKVLSQFNYKEKVKPDLGRPLPPQRPQESWTIQDTETFGLRWF